MASSFTKALERYWQLSLVAVRETFTDDDQTLDEVQMRAYGGSTGTGAEAHSEHVLNGDAKATIVGAEGLEVRRDVWIGGSV